MKLLTPLSLSPRSISGEEESETIFKRIEREFIRQRQRQFNAQSIDISMQMSNILEYSPLKEAQKKLESELSRHLQCLSQELETQKKLLKHKHEYSLKMVKDRFKNRRRALLYQYINQSYRKLKLPRTIKSISASPLEIQTQRYHDIREARSLHSIGFPSSFVMGLDEDDIEIDLDLIKNPTVNGNLPILTDDTNANVPSTTALLHLSEFMMNVECKSNSDEPSSIQHKQEKDKLNSIKLDKNSGAVDNQKADIDKLSSTTPKITEIKASATIEPILNVNSNGFKNHSPNLMVKDHELHFGPEIIKVGDFCHLFDTGTKYSVIVKTIDGNGLVVQRVDGSKSKVALNLLLENRVTLIKKEN